MVPAMLEQVHNPIVHTHECATHSHVPRPQEVDVEHVDIRWEHSAMHFDGQSDDDDGV